ncbi:AAA family ATPase [Gluconacetobacter azotocaptans]|uniref:AAA family ATPase n=1 Tax=Gluconacetobacter azotocaptans TaxID=142834 RepID=A0A7W4JW36_9PROT|nr:AAA family ATPase [Gluconacetobacter azotocaptans]MBB2191972.1 AAA family ATPase [Gluconacetobacter azotocaptans]GBQ27210.1 SMC domain-containing protein [Gluconacetobacter azotocaptans DSM 13594]
MIRIQQISIREFRGIRDLTLMLNGENFAACGPNGTGKSGIVDAIEFGLTGNISRLSGRGTGTLSVKQHGPHVDSQNKPDLATVTIDVTIPSLNGKKASIRRSVKGLNAPTITPADPDVLAVFEQVKAHPEFVLSRRELIRFVLSEPGDRAKEVQALLQLGDVEKLRVVLQKIANAYARELKPLERSEAEATQLLRTALGLTQVGKAAILDAVNPRRAILGLGPLDDLLATTSLVDGLATTGTGGARSRVIKVQAVENIAALQEALAALTASTVSAECAAIAASLTELATDPSSMSGVKEEGLLTTALDLYDGEHCPVCDKAFDEEGFVAHLRGKLSHLADISARKRAIQECVAPVLDLIREAGTAIAATITDSQGFTPPLEVKALGDFKQVLLGRYRQLEAFLPIKDTVAVLGVANSVPDLDAAIGTVSAAVAALPEPSVQDAARDFLTVGQERLDQFRRAGQALAVGRARAERSAKAFEIFGDTTTKALERTYEEVQDEFADCYRVINSDDESGFTAALLPSIGKLAFDVDFYGRGKFPPGAYHSEGHQDGMGLCLYLSLMKHLLGTGFTFAVLDDVLMSVDKGHRREVCTLLKDRFPDTQFIFTTHDDVWLRHMRAEGIIKSKGLAHFRTWTVETGPTEWTNASVWEEIDAHLALNEVSKAAGMLRRFLEYYAAETCHRLRAPVEFRGDAQFMLGDTMPAAIGEFGKLLRKAKDVANSWGQSDVVAAIVAREADFTAAKQATNVDQWQVNTGVHYNAWADLGKGDFAPVVTAFRALVSSFECPTCEQMYSVTPERGPKGGVRCQCGALNLNLVAK